MSSRIVETNVTSPAYKRDSQPKIDMSMNAKEDIAQTKRPAKALLIACFTSQILVFPRRGNVIHLHREERFVEYWFPRGMILLDKGDTLYQGLFLCLS